MQPERRLTAGLLLMDGVLKMPSFKNIFIATAVVVVGLVGGLNLIKWGKENDVPLLKDAADILDQ